MIIHFQCQVLDIRMYQLVCFAYNYPISEHTLKFCTQNTLGMSHIYTVLTWQKLQV